MNKTLSKPTLILHSAGFFSALAYSYLSFCSQEEGAASLADLWGVGLFCAALCFGLWHYYRRSDNHSINVTALLCWAALFRLIGVTSFPVMEDDFYRFLWDGRMLVETGSPYLQAPEESFDAQVSPAMETVLDGINHPDIKTIYGPLNQYLFALGYLIAPGQVWPLQLFMALLDMAVVLMLLKIASVHSVLLYAWCPLVIKEFAFTAHPDIVAIAPLVAALLAVQRQHLHWTAALLGMAVCSKVFALIIVPLLLRFHWRSWLTFVATVLLLTIPLTGGAWPGGLSAMASDWQFNAPLYQGLEHLLPVNTIKLSLLTLLAALWGIYALSHLKKPATTLPRGDWLFGLLLLCSPVFNPWYAIWILPFATIWPSRWAWTTSVAVLLAYASGINMPGSGLALYEQPMWALWLEFGVILLAAIGDTKNPGTAKRHPGY